MRNWNWGAIAAYAFNIVAWASLVELWRLAQQ